MTTILSTDALAALPPNLLAFHLNGRDTPPAVYRPLVKAWSFERYLQQVKWEAKQGFVRFEADHLLHYAEMIDEYRTAAMWPTTLVEQLATNLWGWGRGLCGRTGLGNDVDLAVLQAEVRLTVAPDFQFVTIQIESARPLLHTRYTCELSAAFASIDRSLVDGGMTLWEPRTNGRTLSMRAECDVREVVAQTAVARSVLGNAGWQVRA